MGESGDLIKEFKEAKPPEKAVIVIGVLAVAGVAYYLWQKGQSQAASSPVQTASGQVAGYPTVGANGTPVLPSGVNPLYDPNGNLVAFQNPGATTPPVTTPPAGGTGGTSTPVNWYTNILGKLGYNAKITPGGYDANGQRFWVGSGNSNMFYAPIGSTIQRKSGGLIYITPPGGTQQLLTGPGLRTGGTTLTQMPISTVKK